MSNDQLFTFTDSGISVIHVDQYRGLPYQVYCGRTNPHYKFKASPLANPIHLEHERDRNEVCDQFADYFVKAIQDGNTGILDELTRLRDILAIHKKLELVCWCNPKRCHCSTIKRILETSSQ